MSFIQKIKIALGLVTEGDDFSYLNEIARLQPNNNQGIDLRRDRGKDREKPIFEFPRGPVPILVGSLITVGLIAGVASISDGDIPSDGTQWYKTTTNPLGGNMLDRYLAAGLNEQDIIAVYGPLLSEHGKWEFTCLNWVEDVFDSNPKWHEVKAIFNLLGSVTDILRSNRDDLGNPTELTIESESIIYGALGRMKTFNYLDSDFDFSNMEIDEIRSFFQPVIASVDELEKRIEKHPSNRVDPLNPPPLDPSCVEDEHKSWSQYIEGLDNPPPTVPDESSFSAAAMDIQAKEARKPQEGSGVNRPVATISTEGKIRVLTGPTGP